MDISIVQHPNASNLVCTSNVVWGCQTPPFSRQQGSVGMFSDCINNTHAHTLLVLMVSNAIFRPCSAAVLLDIKPTYHVQQQ